MNKNIRALGCASCTQAQAPSTLGSLSDAAAVDYKALLIQYGAVFIAGAVVGAILLQKFRKR